MRKGNFNEHEDFFFCALLHINGSFFIALPGSSASVLADNVSHDGRRKDAAPHTPWPVMRKNNNGKSVWYTRIQGDLE